MVWRWIGVFREVGVLKVLWEVSEWHSGIGSMEVLGVLGVWGIWAYWGNWHWQNSQPEPGFLERLDLAGGVGGTVGYTAGAR